MIDRLQIQGDGFDRLLRSLRRLALGGRCHAVKKLPLRHLDSTTEVEAALEFQEPPLGFVPPHMRAEVTIPFDMNRMREFPSGISLFEEDGTPFGEERAWRTKDVLIEEEEIVGLVLENS